MGYAMLLLALSVSVSSAAQVAPGVMALPKAERVAPRLTAELASRDEQQQRDAYKKTLRVAYDEQAARDAYKECSAEAKQNESAYTTCMTSVGESAERDFAAFYASLQMLLWSVDDLRTMEQGQAQWEVYEKHALAEAAPGIAGTGAQGWLLQVHLQLLRERMRDLHTIYGMEIAQ